MSKFISRLSLKKSTLCIKITDFTLYAMNTNESFEQFSLELIRGRERKYLNASLATKKQPEHFDPNKLQRRNTLSLNNEKTNFDGHFSNQSQFFLDKQNTGQQKIFNIKVHAHKKDPNQNTLGKHTLLGYCQFDLSQYIDKQNEAVEMDLQKSLIPKSYIKFNITIVNQSQLENLDQFTKDLAEQGNLEAQQVSMNTGINSEEVINKLLKDQLEQDNASAPEVAATDQIIAQAMDKASGRINLDKETFFKTAVPIWLEYDTDKKNELDDEDLFLVIQNTMSQLSQKFGLNNDQYELLSKLIDSNFEKTFQKYDPNGTEKIKQVDFYNMFNELIILYNQAIDEASSGGADKKQVEKAPLTEEEKDKITVESLMNQLNEKDKMLNEFKKNTDVYVKTLQDRLDYLLEQCPEEENTFSVPENEEVEEEEMDPADLKVLKDKHAHQKFLFLALKSQNNNLKDQKSEIQAELDQLNTRIEEQNTLIAENNDIFSKQQDLQSILVNIDKKDKDKDEDDMDQFM